ncbi:THO complex subunit 2 [Phanerochaete sordida]|uniref:THO complex subunit 2 n=1 Tax=Phanerochaete sordida TaxID=48140 RepID=A0A9P3FYA0_9APHY|nr:THO complex subunit 2 [Phanerochaete sordida]
MNIVETVRGLIARWEEGGEAECRDLLTAPHSNPSDPEASDVLSTAYHTLISATLKTWSLSKSLPPQALIGFVQSVLESLPSPSSTRSPHAVAFGDILVDILWAIDVELDDIHQDTKLAFANAEQGNAPAATEGADATAVLARVAQAKQDAESDKEILAGTVKLLVASGILDADVCRERLELSMIHHADLIPDDQAFGKKEVRMRTALFYKQNKFNLLREQSEGYSKLTTELTSSLGPPHSSATGRPVESLSAIEQRAHASWERVVGLVGYFDLDPNRALDIILDVFSVHLMTHYSFFLALLSCSPWGAGLKPRGEDAMNAEASSDAYKGKDLDEVLRIAELQSGHTPREPLLSLSNNGSRVLAQVLGFKLTYYQLPDVNESAPKTLYLAAALLIREGFITLEDIYPHLSPTDDAMEAEHKKYLDSVTARIATAKVSMLAMAAPLESSSSSSGPKPRPATPAEPKAVEKEVVNQKIGLLNALLSVGALRPGLALLSKYPWIVDASPDIADLLLRVCKHSIAPVYATHGAGKESRPNFSGPKRRYGATGVASPPEKKPQLTLWAPTPPSTSATDFVFFFPDWTERVPVCNTHEDVVYVLEPMMRFVGLHIHRDLIFLAQFSRVGRAEVSATLAIDPETKKNAPAYLDNPACCFWYKMARIYLLPALSLVRGNAVCNVEIWTLIRMFETTLRWRLYGEWKTKTYQSHPELRVRYIQADRETKGVLRRLSMQTVEKLSCSVAKLAHSNPLILFTNTINQVMAYENLSMAVILTLSYSTVMGFDVLLYIIVEAFSNPDKARVKDDGVNISDWLQNLASFAGMLYRRYAGDLTPLLKYLVHQLHNGQVSEIIILRELIWKICGIEPLPNLTDSQIVAMAGGPNLQIEVLASGMRGARSDPADSGAKAPSRFGKVIIESGLALALLVQIAQQRQACVYQSGNTHLKSLANLFDMVHGVLLQYIDFLTTPSIVPPDDYAKKVLPSLADMHLKYGICVPICMQIVRPTLHRALLTAALEMQKKERVASEEAEKRLKAALTAKREPTTTSRTGSPAVADVSTSADQSAEAKLVTSAEDVTMEGADQAEPAPAPENPWLPQLYALFDDVKAIAPPNVNDLIGPGFYVTFWQLSTYDLAPPALKYEEETTNLRRMSAEADHAYNAAEKSDSWYERANSYKHRERRNRYNHFIDVLRGELKEQTAARAFTIKRLAREKQHWFAHNPKGIPLAAAIVEHCLHPRALLSPMDADYCVQLIKAVHLQGTPGFSTLNVYDKLLGDHVRVLIFSCSEVEARNYGRFLLGILGDISKWHQDEQLFMQDNRVKSGGKVSYLPGFMLTFSGRANVAIDDIIKWQQFRSVCKKWHRKLAIAFIDCIESGEFMHVYNTIIILKELLPVFPVASVNEGSGNALEIAMEKFLEREERDDLKILGRAYVASLKKREAHWKLPERAVRPTAATTSMKPTPSATPAPAERPRPSGPSTPVPSTNGRPTAGSTVALPTGPRADTAQTNGSAASSADKTSLPASTRIAIESIPRPEVVKRVRPDTRSPAPRVNGEAESKANGPSNAMQVDSPNIPQRPATSAAPPTGPRRDEQGMPRGAAGPGSALRPASPSIPAGSPIPRSISQMEGSRPSTPSNLSRSASNKDLLQSPRMGPGDLRGRGETQTMPPPVNPSQTSSAHELRETAKQTRPLTDKPEEKPARPPPVEPRGQQAPPSAPAPRRRSPSPSSRPGTRNPSVESRASGGRSRGATGDSERSDEKRDRDTRHESRRDVHRSSRSAREGDREKEPDRERRDRHGDRERPRDRERDRDRERERDGHRDRERERDRHRDSDRERDRHRRDEKDRDRESRKDRDSIGRSIPTGPSSSNPPAVDERGLPVRPDPSRRREDDALGKRRRPTEDEPDRASKRPSRKESHHEDRTRRPSDKDRDDRGRESDRRRKERDQPESDARPLTIDTKATDKRPPDGPASASARSLPPTTPSAPRAMATGAESKGGKPDWDRRPRDQPPRGSPTGPGPAQAGQEPQASGGSLRSRITDKEPRPIPSGPRGDASADRKPEGSLNALKDEREGSRKRASSERETGDPSAAMHDSSAPAKRPRINRNRYQGPSATTSAAAFARKSLMDTEKNGRGGLGRSSKD